MFRGYSSSTCSTAAAVTGTLIALSSPGAYAQDLHPSLSDKHTFLAGAYFEESDTRLGASRRGTGGGKIDLDDLGVDDNDVSWLAGYRWRFSERWSLAFNASVFETDGQVTTRRSFTFNGETFEAGVGLRSEFSLDTYIVDVMYSAYKSDRAELQVGGGVHAFDYDIKFTGIAFAGDTTRTGSTASDDLLAPLPNLRAHGIFAITPRWAVYGTLGWLSANVDTWDGEYIYGNLQTDYRLTEHLAVGAGYQAVSVDVSHGGSAVDSSLDIMYRGPTLYMSYAF